MHWIVDSLNCGVVAVDADRRVRVLNDEARSLLLDEGSARGEIVGGDYREILSQRPEVVHQLDEALGGREGSSRAELVLTGMEDPSGHTIGFTLRCLHDPSGELRGAAMLFRDLTPFERQGEQERLRDRLAALGEMAAGMAHEIRNPLAGMEVLAGLLKRRLGGAPEALALLGELTGELHAVERAVTASLNYVRATGISREPCDAKELLESALTRAEKRLAFAGQIERCYPDEPIETHCDPDQLRAVLTDLILNAIDAMQDEPAAEQRLGLEIRVRERKRDIVFCIQDNGPGIPPELRERIFYPFFTTKDEGSGIGLAAAQKVLASHGGRIALESPAAGGARFRVSLPRDGATP
jgi:signal transduction histidine kinase